MNYNFTNTKLLQELGYYVPNRFTIHTDEFSLPITTDNKREFTVFIHEYTHLLQNIFTFSGWLTFAFETLKLTALNNLAILEKKYEVPVYENLTNEKVKHELLLSRNYCNYLFDKQGMSESDNVSASEGINELQVKRDISTKLADDFGMYKISSKFNINGSSKELDINYFILVESMAYIIEEHYGLEKVGSPDFPYKVMNIFFKNTPIHSMSDKKIIVLYLSLQGSSPGLLFKHIYETVVKNQLYEIDDLDIFTESIMKRIDIDDNQKMTELKNFIDDHINTYCQRLYKYPFAIGCADWVKATFVNFKENIEKDILFFIRPLLNKSGPKNIFDLYDHNYFFVFDKSRVLKCIKKPIGNEDDYMRGMLFQMNLFHLIEYLLFFEEKECLLFNSCDSPDKNSECREFPYKQGYKDKECCDYGLAAQLFSFDKIPVVFK